LNDVLALITARRGSKGIPGKNVRQLGGKPLIAWSIEAAQESPSVGRIVTSTDSEEIAKVARQLGAEVPFLRPAELARDESTHIDVVAHCLEWLVEHEGYAPEYVLLLQPTSPLRTTADIEAASAIITEKDADAVIGVVEAPHHPFLLERIAEDGTLTAFTPSNGASLRRQDLPAAYAINGAIYLNRRESLLRERTFLPRGTYPYIMSPERSMDIDTPWDWFLVESVLEARDDR
jgi:CMP-N-acetylneuraminic acid synthetase